MDEMIIDSSVNRLTITTLLLKVKLQPKNDVSIHLY